MHPAAQLAGKLGVARGFIQNAPSDGQAGTERTTVYLAHTTTTLYFVFLCFESHPELIRRHLARRENILNDDNIAVLLDPFRDWQRGVLFQVNSLGVQADAAWSEGVGADYSYDQVWDSDSALTSQGWIALIAIPFRSLRFSLNKLEWGVVLQRNLPRNSETDYWPRVTPGVSGVLSQEGTLRLTGMEGIPHSHNLEITPYVLGQNIHSIDSVDPDNPYFSTRNAEATAGGEAKLILSNSIVIDGTINPDFSDVESDQPQFTVNQRYPVYFPELRPFFLENAAYFSTPIQLLYTRNFVRPDWGVRATGKIGHTNFGLLSLDDREPGETVNPDDPLHGQKATAFVARVSEDVGKASSVGLLYTEEDFGGGWNKIGGVDFKWRVDDHWTLLGQTLVSSTHPSTASSMAALFPTRYEAGPATYFEVDRSGHALNLQSITRDYGSGFLSTVGFVQTTDYYNNQTHATYQWFKTHSVIQSYGLEINNQVAFDHAGNRLYHYTTFDPFLLLSRGFVIAPLIGQNSDTVGPQNGYNLAANKNFTENVAGFVVRGQPSQLVDFTIQGFDQGNVNYNPVPGAAPFLMHQQTVQALVSINPLRQLTDDNTYLLDRDHSTSGGSLVYESQRLRTKLNYQFTRSLSARVITEYDSTLSNPLQTSLPRTKQIQTQALLTWLPHPGTMVYVGWNSSLQNFNHTICQYDNGVCDPTQPILARGPGYLNDGRQFFLKASYRIRF